MWVDLVLFPSTQTSFPIPSILFFITQSDVREKSFRKIISSYKTTRWVLTKSSAKRNTAKTIKVYLCFHINVFHVRKEPARDSIDDDQHTSVR